MATKKKVVKMRDLKPAKDAKGGVSSLNRGKQQEGLRKKHLKPAKDAKGGVSLNRGKQQDSSRKQLDGSTRQGS